eukprot:969542_1
MLNKASQSTNIGVLESVDLRLARNVAHKKGNNIIVGFHKRAGTVVIFCALLSVLFAPVGVVGEGAANGGISTVQIMNKCDEADHQCILHPNVLPNFPVCAAHRSLKRAARKNRITNGFDYGALRALVGAVSSMTNKVLALANVASGGQKINIVHLIQVTDAAIGVDVVLGKKLKCSRSRLKDFKVYIRSVLSENSMDIGPKALCFLSKLVNEWVWHIARNAGVSATGSSTLRSNHVTDVITGEVVGSGPWDLFDIILGIASLASNCPSQF